VTCEEPPERAHGEAVTAHGKLALKFDKGYVACFGDDPENEIALCLNALRAPVAALRLGPRRPRAAGERAPTNGARHSYAEPFSSLTARKAAFNGRHDTLTKIKRKGLRHRDWPPSASLNVESAEHRFGNPQTIQSARKPL